MKKKANRYTLFIDEAFASPLTSSNAMQLSKILRELLINYFAYRSSTSLCDWLRSELAEQLPEYSVEEISEMSDEIISSLKVQEQKKESLDNAVSNGQRKESWFANEIKEAISYMDTQTAVNYLQALDNTLMDANESFYRTLHTKSGSINQNPNLDGFIAEQYHAQTFNLNAAAMQSPYRAKVLEPDGHGYAKNSADIALFDENGHIIRYYQSKYYKTPKATEHAFNQGSYSQQWRLVPSNQKHYISTKVATVLESPGPNKVTSKCLSKGHAQNLQKIAQTEHWKPLTWNDYQIKNMAVGIGKQVSTAAMYSAALSTGAEIISRINGSEPIDCEILLKEALTSASDSGVKVAASVALKVGAEKGLIRGISKGIPASVCSDIAFIGVESAKTISKAASGDLTVYDVLDELEKITISTVAGRAASIKGCAIGATVGSILGPAGSVAAGFIGGCIGYLVGSHLAERTVTCIQKIKKKATECIVNRISNRVHSFSDHAFNTFHDIKTLFI